MTSLVDIEGRYALAWYRLRLRELDRVPFPDLTWLKPSVERKYDNQLDMFDCIGDD